MREMSDSEEERYFSPARSGPQNGDMADAASHELEDIGVAAEIGGEGEGSVPSDAAGKLAEKISVRCFGRDRNHLFEEKGWERMGRSVEVKHPLPLLRMHAWSSCSFPQRRCQRLSSVIVSGQWTMLPSFQQRALLDFAHSFRRSHAPKGGEDNQARSDDRHVDAPVRRSERLSFGSGRVVWDGSCRARRHAIKRKKNGDTSSSSRNINSSVPDRWDERVGFLKPIDGVSRSGLRLPCLLGCPC